MSKNKVLKKSFKKGIMQNEQKQSERKRQIKQKLYFLSPECELFRTYKELFPSQKPFEKVLSLWEIGPLHKKKTPSRQRHQCRSGMVPDARSSEVSRTF